MACSDFRFRWTHRVRFSEVDPQAVVFNSRYLEYFDAAMVEYWRAIGVFGAGGLTSAPEMRVAKAVVEYKAAIRVDELVDVCVRCSRIGTTSLTFLFELHGAGKDDLRAAGEEIHVHVDARSGRPAPLPVALTATYEKFEERRLTTAPSPAPMSA